MTHEPDGHLGPPQMHLILILLTKRCQLKGVRFPPQLAQAQGKPGGPLRAAAQSLSYCT